MGGIGLLIMLVIWFVFVCSVFVGGMALICRPLDHQYEWEKRLQGDKIVDKKDTN